MTSAEVLLDTSVAIALMDPSHPRHELARQRCRDRRLGLSGHALFETFSVLTRMPAPHRLDPATAWRVLAHNFPASVALSPGGADAVIPALVARGLGGGAVYDGLVAAAAQEDDLPLLTLDDRAALAYAAQGVRWELLGR